jgi:PGF-pre-PGF domain-containing protein
MNDTVGHLSPSSNVTFRICAESWSCGAWSACYAGSRNRVCTDANSCGTLASRPAISELCEAPGGGGGGGGGSPTVVEPKQVNKSWEKMEPGAAVSMSINKSGLEFSEIRIEVKNPVKNITIKVTKLEGKPAEVSHNASGKAYQYVSVNATNLNQSVLNSTKIRFRVAKSWITLNGIDKHKVHLNRYENGNWIILNTTYDGEDSENAYYLADTPGFSYFVITGEIRAPELIEEGKAACNGNGVCEEGEYEAGCADCIPQKQCEAGMFMCHGGVLDGCVEGQWVTYRECEHGCFNARCLEAAAQPLNVPASIIVIISGAIAIIVELVLWRKRYSPWRYFRI